MSRKVEIGSKVRMKEFSIKHYCRLKGPAAAFDRCHSCPMNLRELFVVKDVLRSRNVILLTGPKVSCASSLIEWCVSDFDIVSPRTWKKIR